MLITNMNSSPSLIEDFIRHIIIENQLDKVKESVSSCVYVKNNISFAVIFASENGHLEVVKYLVSVGADVKSNTSYAVGFASENGHLEVVKYLVSVGANVKSNNDYAIKWASGNGHLEVVKYLVSVGANVKSNNNSAFRWALRNDHLEVVKYLVSAGADIYGIIVSDKIVSGLLNISCFEILRKLLKNNNEYPEIKKIVNKINDGLLINSINKSRCFTDVVIL